MEPIKNKYYLVKILDHKDTRLVGLDVKVKFSGILFRSLKSTNDYLYLSQVEIIKEIEEPNRGNNSQNTNEQTELAL